MIVARPLKNTNFATAVVAGTDIVGDLVYISGNIIGGDYQATKVDPTAGAKMPVIAVIIYKISGTRAVIQFEGNVNGVYTGLTAGRTYYADSSGQPSLVPPVAPLNGKAYVQPIGVALDSNVLHLKPSKQLIILRNP